MQNSCGKGVVPTEVVGQWKSEKCLVTVRTEPNLLRFEFLSDSAIIILNIKPDRSVSGFIGLSSFEKGIIRKNKGNSNVTGIAYIVECGRIGKIFNHDPLDSKEVELWISPIEDVMKAELRFTEGMSVLPMGEFVLTKKKSE